MICTTITLNHSFPKSLAWVSSNNQLYAIATSLSPVTLAIPQLGIVCLFQLGIYIENSTLHVVVSRHLVARFDIKNLFTKKHTWKRVFITQTVWSLATQNGYLFRFLDEREANRRCSTSLLQKLLCTCTARVGLFFTRTPSEGRHGNDENLLTFCFLSVPLKYS